MSVRETAGQLVTIHTRDCCSTCYRRTAGQLATVLVHRLVATLLGIIVIDAMLAYNFIEKKRQGGRGGGGGGGGGQKQGIYFF